MGAWLLYYKAGKCILLHLVSSHGRARLAAGGSDKWRLLSCFDAAVDEVKLSLTSLQHHASLA